MTTVSLAVLVSVSVLLRLSLRVKSILSIPISASSAALALTLVLLKLSAWDNPDTVKSYGVLTDETERAYLGVCPLFYHYFFTTPQKQKIQASVPKQISNSTSVRVRLSVRGNIPVRLHHFNFKYIVQCRIAL